MRHRTLPGLELNETRRTRFACDSGGKAPPKQTTLGRATRAEVEQKSERVGDERRLESILPEGTLQGAGPALGKLLVGDTALPLVEVGQVRPGIGRVRVQLNRLLLKGSRLFNVAQSHPCGRTRLRDIEVEAVPSGFCEQIGWSGFR